MSLIGLIREWSGKLVMGSLLVFGVTLGEGIEASGISILGFFSISEQNEAMVGEMGLVSELGMEWNFTWRRHLFMWEEEVLLSLKEDLDGVRLSNQVDKWRWKFDESGGYTVNSAYKRLEGLVFSEVLRREEDKGVF